MSESPRPQFGTAMRGYSKESVDAYVARMLAENEQLHGQVSAESGRAARLAQDLETATQDATSSRDEAIARADQAEARNRRLAEEIEQLNTQITAAQEGDGAERVPEPALSTHMHFEEILRVAEEQANTVIANAVKQGERLLDETKKQIVKDKAAAEDEGRRILARAKNEAEQTRLALEADKTAHEARMEQQTAEITEKISQAEREAAVVLAEGQRASASLRDDAEREAHEMREDAEGVLTRAREQANELEIGTTARRDEMQKEFLRLHNEAVAHAERITTDANEKVGSALRHSEHITQQARTSEELAAAQAQQIVADAKTRAQNILAEARRNSTNLTEKVRAHVTDALHEAEDRSRSLRWQQQQITTFSAEIDALLKLREAPTDDGSEAAPAQPDEDAEHSAETRLGAEQAEQDAEVPAEHENGSEPAETVETVEEQTSEEETDGPVDDKE